MGLGVRGPEVTANVLVINESFRVRIKGGIVFLLNAFK